MALAEYIIALEKALSRHDATEHTHRPALKDFLERLQSGIVATNEPRQSGCGAPDYVISRSSDHLTLGYVEAKDVGTDLAQAGKTDQLRRYIRYLPNLLLTDYLEFCWYVNGEKRETVRLGTVGSKARIHSVSTAEQDRALQVLQSFLAQKPVKISSAEELAQRLARFTHLIRDIIAQAFASASASQQLRDWRTAFASTLLPELAEHADAAKEEAAVAEFADMFAQTLAYGLFSARAVSGTTKFTRDKARKLIPRTNPFLRSFFEQITGSALDEEPFAGFVEDIIQVLDHADMAAVLEDFGKQRRRRDPVVHFYETFLHAYDPELRELRGVYYTPEPVVNYIVQSIDLLLKKKFALKQGLADASKIKMDTTGAMPVSSSAAQPGTAATVPASQPPPSSPTECHRVLVLDPATGTATFLYTVLDFIRSQFKKKKNAGQWSGYVHEHLLPRLFGFELLMAPYAVAHFKLGLALAAWDEEPLFRQQWSYEPQAGERLNIFLTNTLEDLERAAEQLGPLRALSDEANSAYEVKKQKPVLVVLGNPPYSGHSANKGEWISSLVRDYYFCDGKPLGERNPKWLQNDYVKFIRWGQWRIEQTGQGILAFITSNSYLSSPTFRGMRQNLMQTFDEIYILDLHGNSKKKEKVPGTNSPDKNVFDITEGVAIGIFVKLPPGSRGRRKASLTVRHSQLWGTQRKTKYDWLDDHHVQNTGWTTLEPQAPHHLFIPQDTKRHKEYQRGWAVTEMMPVHSLGIAAGRDHFTVAFTANELRERLRRFVQLDPQQARKEFALGPDSRDWQVKLAQDDLDRRRWESCIETILYRPFDHRATCYTGTSRGIHCMPRNDVMRHLLQGRMNLALSTTRSVEISQGWHHVFATRDIIQLHSVSMKEVNYLFPLYLYPNGNLPEDDLFAHENGRRPNLGGDFIRAVCDKLKVKFAPEGLGRPGRGEIGPELIFNYAYAIFHSPGYRERYAEFLRADFPRLPLTSDFDLFRILARLGGELVALHAGAESHPRGITYPIKGDNVIEEVRYQPAGKDHRLQDHWSTGSGDHQTTGERDERPVAAGEGASRRSSIHSPTAGRVWINKRQYFEGVSEAAWTFPIGGYLPAQRWLKDRLGRALSYDDQTAYTRLIHALVETRRLMFEIDTAITQHGGWPLRGTALR